MKQLAIAVLIAMPASILAQPAQLPDYHTKGFWLGLHANATSWRLEQGNLDIDQTDSGGGAGFTLAYGISNLVSFFLNVDAASISPEDNDSYTLGSADLGARFSFGSGQSKLRPFVEAALSGAGAEFEREGPNIEVTGGGLGAGLGLVYFFSRQVGLDAGVDFVFGNLSSVKVGNVAVDPNIDAFTSRINVGIVWFPGK